MAADFSRVRNNPLLNYAAVELKQGGVLLDADANELAAILDRRLRALAGDVLARATVGANTPDAFRITPGGGGLLIGRGRLYVDGLLAENHGAADPAQREFDDLMAETRFTADTPYSAQPYLPDPPALPETGRHLVYLDVWDREVTHVEQPDLVEIAVGVETSSRLQTVWQVRVLAEDAGADTTCGSPDAGIPGWPDIIAPSTGRLTTGTYDVSAVADPCELPPTGGYRGLENQLYRVEIHDPGQPGASATFKWSRNNASFAVSVDSVVSSTVLQLDSLGRDDVLRFKSGDWVEITDDVREFSQAAGEIRKITVDEANLRISFTPPLPAAMLPTSFPDSAFPAERHTRVRLWDQHGKTLAAIGNGSTNVFTDLDAVGSTGVIPVPAAGTTLLLENGVTVSFASVGPKGFRAGDYWVFAARTADASVEILDQAPPRGIHHHYARLAIWDAASGADPTDCRHPWPPRGGEDCGCTECVTPESHASGELTIQDAVNRVKDTGGTVCLQAGAYTLREPVRIAGARSVRIKGQGPATAIAAAAGAFAVKGSSGIVIEDLSVIALAFRPAITVETAGGLTLQKLVLVVIDITRDAPAIGISLAGVVAGLAIRENLIVAATGIRALDPAAEEGPSFLGTVAIGIEANIFVCEQQAIDFTGTVLHLLESRICDNEVLSCRTAGISVLGVAAPGASMRIADNCLSVNGAGIRCGVDGAWIEGNKVNAAVQDDRQPAGAGIHLLTAIDPAGSDQCQVLANQIRGFPTGIRIDAPIVELIITLNIIEQCGNGIVMADSGSAGSLSIENNHLRDIGAPLDPKAPNFVLGIAAGRADSATVVGNTLRRIGVQAARGTSIVAGIFHGVVARSRIAGNDIVEVGPPTELPGAIEAGILLFGPYDESDVSGNHVKRDAAPAAADAAPWAAITAIEAQVKQPIVHAGAFTAVRLNDTRTLVFNGARPFIHEAAVAVDAAGAAVVRRSSFGVRGNALAARGIAPVVTILAGADIQFVDNRCELIGRGTAVSLLSGAAVVSANIVRGGETSIAASAALNRATMVGNATTGVITIDQQSLVGTPWEHLNVRI